MNAMSYIVLKRILGIGLAFVIFGFIDNAVMVIAGGQIDKAIGAMGFSVLFSAGLGNTLSDVAGILIGRGVALKVSKRLPSSEGLSTTYIVIAEAIGITLGCLLGLTPLLFL